jgi:Calpain family cysteine protease
VQILGSSSPSYTLLTREATPESLAQGTTSPHDVATSSDATLDQKYRALQANQQVYDTLRGVAEPEARSEVPQDAAYQPSEAAAEPSNHTPGPSTKSSSSSAQEHATSPKTPSERTASTIARPHSAFVATVEKNFVKWDTNHDGALEANEIDAAVADPSNQGQAATAAATLDWLQSAPGFTRFGAKELRADEAQVRKQGDSNDDSTMRYFDGRLSTFEHATSLYGKAGVPSINDIDQGQQGDCYFLSALGSKVQKDPQSVMNMIASNPDGTYTVTFSGGSVTVPPPTQAQAAEAASTASGGRWVQVVEDAYAQYVKQKNGDSNPNPYEAIGNGGAMGTAMIDVGAPSVQVYNLGSGGSDGIGSPAQLGTTLSSALASGQSVLASTDQPKDGLPGGHAYTVEGFDPTTQTVTVRNPWGMVGDSNPNPSKQGITDLGQGNFKLSLNDFYSNFSSVVTG